MCKKVAITETKNAKANVVSEWQETKDTIGESTNSTDISRPHKQKWISVEESVAFHPLKGRNEEKEKYAKHLVLRVKT